MTILRLFCVATLLPSTPLLCAEPPDASLKACQEEVAKAVSEHARNYKADLKELLREFQKAGDLDSFLAVRDELARFEKSPQINPSNIVKEPELLAILQGDCQRSCYEGTSKIAGKHVNALLPSQISLTREGRIDEALAVRSKIRAIQGAYKDSLAWAETSRLSPAVHKVSSRSLIMGYARTEAVARRLFGERRLLVEGVVSQLDRDFAHGDLFNVYFSSAEEPDVKVQFAFKTSEVEVKRIQAGGREAVVFTKKGDAEKGPLTLMPGMKLEIEGRCEGKHLNVNLADVKIPDGYWPEPKPAPKAPAE